MITAMLSMFGLMLAIAYATLRRKVIRKVCSRLRYTNFGLFNIFFRGLKNDPTRSQRRQQILSLASDVPELPRV